MGEGMLLRYSFTKSIMDAPQRSAPRTGRQASAGSLWADQSGAGVLGWRVQPANTWKGTMMQLGENLLLEGKVGMSQECLSNFLFGFLLFPFFYFI